MVDWKPNPNKTCYKCKWWEKIGKVNHPQDPDEYDGDYCILGDSSKIDEHIRPLFGNVADDLHWLLTLIHEVDDSRMNSLACGESIEKENMLIANICPLYTPKEE